MEQINSWQALMQLLKAYIGTGILAMPKAICYSGIILGVIGIPIIGLICNTCIHMLLDINKILCEKYLIEKNMDYEQLAEETLKNGPVNLRKYSKLSRFLVIIFLVLTQLGFCCSYCLFMAENIRKFSINMNKFESASMAVQYYLLILLPFITMINFIKSNKWLSVASSIANLVQLACFVIIIYNLVQNIPPLSTRTSIGSELPLFFGTSLYTIEAITIVMPLYQSMKNPEQFAKPLGVANLANLIVVILYSLIGLLGYLKFGDEVEAVITLSLPNEPLYNSLQILYSLVLVVTYVLQMSVAVRQLWPPIESSLVTKNYSSKAIVIFDYLFRTLLVVITFALVAFIPRLDLIIALSGAISCSFIAIIIPPVLHSIANWETKLCANIWIHTRNAIIFLIGLLGFVTGTYFSLIDIVDYFRSSV